MMDNPNVNAILDAVIRAEREAAELIMHAHGILAEAKTGHRDVVTEYDKRVQALLMESTAISVRSMSSSSTPLTAR